MRSKTSDAKLINLFLDMLAAEQGAGPNTLDAYRRDLTDFSEFLARTGKAFASVETQALRDYPADLDARGCPVRTEARPRGAEGAVDIRCRSSAGARQGTERGAGNLCAAAASRDATILPAGGALRHRLVGVGTGGAAIIGVGAGCPHDRGTRQGRQGKAGV